MANKVLLKKSSVAAKVPLTTDLDYGELALNYADGKIYFKNASNVIKSFTIDDNVVTLAGTQTLTNKTLTSPTINGGALSGTFSGAATLSGAITISNTTASTSSSTGALTVGGGLGVAGSIYADQIRLLNNGNGTNVYVGDDTIIGDVNLSNTISIRGQQDSTQAYLVFGSSNNTNYIGRSGTNPLQVTGQFKVDSGTVTGTNAIAFQIAGYANKGGIGYHDFLSVTNSYSTATNPNKFFRLNSTGQLEIINSGYTAAILSLSDAGVFSVPQISAGGSTGTSGQVLSSTGTGLQWITAGGSVTSVGLSLPSMFTVTGSPVTTSGTLTATLASQTANTFLAAPNGAAGAPTFRTIVAADIPTLNQSTTGNAATATTATNLAGGSAGTIPYQTAAGTTAMLAAGTSGYFLKSNNTSAPSWVELSLTDLPDAWTKKSVRVATTANITLSGTQTIDGIAVVAGDRVLVKDQTTASQNGIYVVAAGAWSRSTDANTVSKLAGACVNVDSGTANGGFRFDTDLKATDTLDTTALYFFRVYDTGDSATANTANKLVLRDGSGNFSAGTITAALTGNASTATTLQTARNINGVSFNGSADITITAAAGTLTGTALNSTVVSSSLTSVGTITTGVWNAGAVTSSGGVQGTTLTSTVATGTAPLVVTSTTKVANLNVEQVDGYHADTANTASTIAVRDSSGEITASGYNATGGMFEHSNTISANYAISSGNNAISAGPVTVANGVTVTIPTGSTWVIV